MTTWLCVMRAIFAADTAINMADIEQKTALITVISGEDGSACLLHISVSHSLASDSLSERLSTTAVFVQELSCGAAARQGLHCPQNEQDCKRSVLHVSSAGTAAG